MHHGTCVTHVPWCMSGSLTHGGGEHDPGIPGACTTRNFTCLPRGPWQFSLQVFANPKEFYINDNPAGVAVDGIFFGQVSDKAEKMDCAFANTVTNHLFAQPPDAPSTDLPSLNVHRGRDHGLPSEFQGPVLLQWPCSVYRDHLYHDDVIKWKHFPHYWPFVRGIHRSPVAGNTIPAFPVHTQPAILRIWQETHDNFLSNFLEKRKIIIIATGDLATHEARPSVVMVRIYFYQNMLV